MKKFTLICSLITLITTSCTFWNQNKEEKFVNPIFYETMTSTEYPSFKAQLTPTHIYIHENEHLSRNYNCKLLTNQKDKIVLECPVYNEAYDKDIITTFTYTITPCLQEKYCTKQYKWLVTQNIKPYENYHEDILYKISSKKTNKTVLKKFSNPLFYKTLLPISKNAWETKLTPTIQMSRNDNKTDISTCKILRNSMDYVVLQCTYFNFLQKSYKTQCYKYEIWKCNKEKEYCYDLNWKVAEKRLNCQTLTENGGKAIFMVEEEDKP